MLRLGTGWEPPICGSEMFEQLQRPNLTDFFQTFCKKHMSHPFPLWNFFWGVQKFFLPPQTGRFLGAPALSKKWGPIPRNEGPVSTVLKAGVSVDPRSIPISIACLHIYILLMQAWIHPHIFPYLLPFIQVAFTPNLSIFLLDYLFTSTYISKHL